LFSDVGAATPPPASSARADEDVVDAASVAPNISADHLSVCIVDPRATAIA
jgi:hypothetical protein